MPILILVGVIVAVLAGFLPFDHESAEYTMGVMTLRLGVAFGCVYWFWLKK